MSRYQARFWPPAVDSAEQLLYIYIEEIFSQHLMHRKDRFYGETLSMNTTTYSVPTVFGRIHNKQTPVTAEVPGSKSITNRALLLATLAQGTSTLTGVLFSDDSRHFLQCIEDLGFATKVDEEKKTISVTGLGGVVPRKEATLDVGSAGTAARFLTAYLGVASGTYHMTSSPQMQKRPMAPLLHSLEELGCAVTYDDPEAWIGHFPFTLQGNGFQKQAITINIDSSSQFMSALLIASCLSGEDFTITMEGSHGLAYVEMTVRMMEQFGVKTTPLYYCDGNEENHDCIGCVNSTRPYAYRTAAGQAYTAREYAVEPDVSAACYFYACSPLLGIPVMVKGVFRDSLQGDVAFLDILVQMGCSMTETREGLLVEPPADGIFHGVTADMSACSDQAITLAAIAPFASSPTTITGIGHIRLQESDRLTAISTELTRLGIRNETTADSITIYPGTPKPGTVDTYEDHRMAMGFALIGLRSEGIVIRDPSCCRKTFENYFEVLEEMIRSLTE